ncbi:hypothetical protein CITRIK5_70684 [Citricoccus sp. K5]|nr:hypothetical protein CITRIK5_70684 [Citricoccus sp. K5]
MTCSRSLPWYTKRHPFVLTVKQRPRTLRTTLEEAFVPIAVPLTTTLSVPCRGAATLSESARTPWLRGLPVLRASSILRRM